METQSQDVKRGPGRPKQVNEEIPVKKKGKSSWKPASLNEFYNKEEGYTYRMIRKDPDNLAKKQVENWEIVSGIQSGNTKHIEPGRINDGKPLTSVQEGKDWILQRISEETALERDAYYNNETNRREAGLTAHVKKEVAKEGANTHGEITISNRNGTKSYDA